MTPINMDSILAKAKKATSSASFQKKIDEKIDSIVTGRSSNGSGNRGGGTSASNPPPPDAAKKFIEVLQNEIKSHAISEGGGFSSGKLGESAIDALIKLDYGAPIKLSKRLYQIAVWFTEDLGRESLAPDRYKGIENIAALLNSGYTAGHRVYGVWNGHGDERIASIVKRDGAHFIENSIRNFLEDYAKEYGVTNIEVDEVYK